VREKEQIQGPIEESLGSWRLRQRLRDSTNPSEGEKHNRGSRSSESNSRMQRDNQLSKDVKGITHTQYVGQEEKVSIEASLKTGAKKTETKTKTGGDMDNKLEIMTDIPKIKQVK
jgi:hypothetical protein